MRELELCPKEGHTEPRPETREEEEKGKEERGRRMPKIAATRAKGRATREAIAASRRRAEREGDRVAEPAA
jgi:hypothetical protein